MVAVQNMDAEVFVVDNNSVDGSVAMVETKFQNVILIANKDNSGFSKANNQAIEIAKGEYVLLLTPIRWLKKTPSRKSFSSWMNIPMLAALGLIWWMGKEIFFPRVNEVFQLLK